MMHNLWKADRFWFRVTGVNPQHMVSQAAGRGIRLAHLRREPDGFTAQAFGADRLALERLAGQGGGKFSLLRRNGPGQFLEFLVKRPGLPFGLFLFVFLLQQLSLFVWVIDFGDMTPELQSRMRTLLADCGIREGILLKDETLQTAQIAALQQSDVFGWISLNFAGGCLRLEETAAEYQRIREEAPLQPLYAREDGEILSIETQSGYTVVDVGQTVEKGALLVDVVRLDRSGREILQGASGRILARMEKDYTAFQPLESEQTILTGQRFDAQELTILGYSWKGEAILPSEGIVQTEWLPLQLGRVSLPASLCQKTVWPQAQRTVTYSRETAQDLARRNCLAQLYADFPDAAIETEQYTATHSDTAEGCTIRYRFCANIAAPA